MMFFLKTIIPALFLIFLLVNSPFAQSVDESALALKKSGEAFRKPAGFETSDEQVQVGTWFSNFDSLRTAAASFLAILFTDDKSMLKMKENTRMTIQGNVSPTQSLRQVRIDRGALRATIIFQDKRKYEIITPVSVASVKGTDFWLTVDPNGTDTFIGLEGSVEILNIESGQSMLLTAGNTIISSWTGTMNINPTDPSTIPSDPDTEPEGGQEGESGESPDQQPAPSSPAQPTPAQEQSEQESGPTLSPEKGGSKLPGGIGLSASVGAAVLDGQVYNQISIRPDFPIGPFGVGLDLNLYFDADGNLREEDWDEPLDAVDKIFYIRYNQPDDPFYIRAGGLTNVTMGQGLIMDNYSNMIEYPQIRRVGLLGHREFGKIKFQGLVANLRELGSPGLVGTRVTYPLIGNLRVGGTFVLDGDQFAGLPDKDGDGVPDAVDDFPDDKAYAVDSDGDGIPDEVDYDQDDDQLTDSHPDPAFNIDDTIDIVIKTPLSFKDKKDGVSSYGVDIEYALFSNDLIGITAYGEVAAIKDFGSGFTFPGVRATLGPVFLRAEYRRYGKQFIGNYFNRTYDIERAHLFVQAGDSTIAKTREELLLKSIKDPLSGVFGGASINLLNLFTLSASYLRMQSSNPDSTPNFESFFGDVSIDPVFIPKINRASLFYQQTNVPNVFDFIKTPSTLFGLLIGYEIAPSVTLLIRYQETYIDRDGDGKIRGDDETIKLTSIETEFTF
ncbi:MAG: FecR domain-containing protein [Candidatus Marinimicrobia bacterium]|nr:FecR domain-containing protein [Candidatus Neomarinimicrobiota bacterium]